MTFPAIDFIVVLVLLLSLAVAADAAPPDLPEAEKQMVNTVDPWGLAFSDQLSRFQSHFAAAEEAPFVVGVTHDLVKIWPTKYWFRGETFLPGQTGRAAQRWVAAGETQAFQVAILPRVGASQATYSVEAYADGAEIEVSRQVFIKTSEAAAYPRYDSDRWPDPLLVEGDATVSGPDCAAFWVDVTVPAGHPSGQIECVVKVSAGDSTAGVIVPIRVVGGLELRPKDYPFIAWFRRHKMSPEQYRDLCALVLRHHVVPVDALKGQWDHQDPSKFDDLRAFLQSQGQWMFELDQPREDDARFDALYQHLKERGWLDNTWVYSHDEPDETMWREKNIPFAQMVRSKYPGLKIYVASDGHANMEEGVDAWMTDISASGYDPVKQMSVERPELWHYYCHLPIRWQMRAPLVWAPNMQTDNPALEQRLALWMSHYFGAKAVFIWAGNAYGLDADFWQKLSLQDTLSGYPYGGAHNGNGWVVYPAPEGEGSVASLRLKLIRDGIEDVALLEACTRLVQSGRIAGETAERLKSLLNPVPGVFVHPQYFDRLPETLLARREAILEAVDGALGR